jgi:hypothetical protein
MVWERTCLACWRARIFLSASRRLRARYKKRLFRRDVKTSTRDVCAPPIRCHLPLDFLTWPKVRSRAMQNAQNLMSSFEFIAALMSIIVGLGVTNLLAGAGRAFYRRKENPLDEVHLVLTVATLVLLVLQWWVAFRWNTEANWTFDKFLVLIAWTVVLYFLTVFLYPPRFIGRGRTPRPVRTQPRRLLLSVHRDVFARHRANGSSWGTFAAGMVRSVRRAICAPCRRGSHCQPTRLRSLLCVVPIDHNARVGTSGEKVSGRKRDDTLIASLVRLR